MQCRVEGCIHSTLFTSVLHHLGSYCDVMPFPLDPQISLKPAPVCKWGSLHQHVKRKLLGTTCQAVWNSPAFQTESEILSHKAIIILRSANCRLLTWASHHFISQSTKGFLSRSLPLFSPLCSLWRAETWESVPVPWRWRTSLTAGWLRPPGSMLRGEHVCSTSGTTLKIG